MTTQTAIVLLFGIIAVGVVMLSVGVGALIGRGRR